MLPELAALNMNVQFYSNLEFKLRREEMHVIQVLTNLRPSDILLCLLILSALCCQYECIRNSEVLCRTF